MIGEEHIEHPQRHLILPRQFVKRLIGDRPSVKNVQRFIADGVVVTITDFVDGQPGQRISILGDGATTIQDNANIVLGADLLLTADKVYTFTNFNGVWYPEA